MPLKTIEDVQENKEIKDISHKNMLKNLIQPFIENAESEYGIVIINLKTNESYFLNEERKFDTASIYKLWVMGEAYNQIKSGKITGDDLMSSDIEKLNNIFNIASESAERTEGMITESVNEALNKMITISDNYSAYLLTLKTKISNINQFLETNKFNNSKLGTADTYPQSTAHDIASYFLKLYNNELVDREYSQKMLSLLKNQQVKRKLPKLLSDDVTIAHKTGELFGFTHDAGIVYTPKGDYIIVIMTESSNPSEKDEAIAQISKSVYDYFTK